MISSRFGIPVSLLLVAALVPTVIHNYIGAKTTDGLTTAAISSVLVGLESKRTKRGPKWGKIMFGSDDWIERHYGTAGDTKVLLFAARSYDLKRLYHHPELAVLYGSDLKDTGSMRMPGASAISARILRSRTGRGVAAYVLLYDGRFVENPITFQLRTSWKLVFSPRKQMTLFLVYDRGAAPDVSFDTLPASRVLMEAIESFRSQQGGPD